MDDHKPANILFNLIKHLIESEQYDSVAALFINPNEAEKNLVQLPEISLEILYDFCLPYLNDSFNVENGALYGCAEELLKLISAYGPIKELLIELLALIEKKSECTFTSALRALQVLILRHDKPRDLRWCFESIVHHLRNLPQPKFLTTSYDKKQEKLLEQNEQIQSILMKFITVGFFYENLVQHFCLQSYQNNEVFYNCGETNRNILCCFLIKLLGKPISLLNLKYDGQYETNMHSFSCAKKLTESITQCITNPYYFLPIVEYRLSRNMKYKMLKSAPTSIKCLNIFLFDDVLCLKSLAIYYYMLHVQKINQNEIPLIYSPLFIFESGLYLSHVLMTCEEPALHDKALDMVKSLLEQLYDLVIPAHYLELRLYRKFSLSLCKLIIYSSETHLRQTGVHLLRHYILQFDDDGKYMILKNLLITIENQGLIGYLTTIYKDLVAQALLNVRKKNNFTSDGINKPLFKFPSMYCGVDFRFILMRCICVLPHGVETDALENSDKIISAINVLRFFALTDQNNYTGFWNHVNEIHSKYLTPLRKNLDLSEAHYKAELKRMETSSDKLIEAENRKQEEQIKLLNLDISNDSSKNDNTSLDIQLSRLEKIEVLKKHLCTFDLIRSLLVRVNECLDSLKN